MFNMFYLPDLCYPLEVKTKVLVKKLDMNYVFTGLSKHWVKK